MVEIDMEEIKDDATEPQLVEIDVRNDVVEEPELDLPAPEPEG